jgi:hypothetical protein
VALALCAAVVAAATLESFVAGRPARAASFSPVGLPLAAAALAAVGAWPRSVGPRWLHRAQRILGWFGLLLMVWTAGGLPLHLLRLTGLIPLPVEWWAVAIKTLALAASIALGHLALVRPPSSRPATWYGYAAFVLALPYPVLRTCWALGWSPGLQRPGAAGSGWAPWLLAIPWLLAAGLSLLLVPTWRWMPRRLLLIAGWSATAIVGTIGLPACWALVSRPAIIDDPHPLGIALWVFGLFYGSWLLWAIAAAAATRSYQLRTVPGDVFAPAPAASVNPG